MDEAVETKRDRVRRLLITPLLSQGIRKQTRMSADDYATFLVRLADKLGYLEEVHLRGLVMWITAHAKGKDRDQWPAEVSIVSKAHSLQGPPARGNPYVTTVMRSQAGRTARSEGFHAELYLDCVKYGPPFNAAKMAALRRLFAENDREVGRVQRLIEDGRAPEERRQWLVWYLRNRAEAEAIMDQVSERAAV